MSKSTAWTRLVAFALLLAVLAAGPTGRADPLAADDVFDLELDAQPVGFPDPLEPMNRGLLRFNVGLDRWLLDPFTRFYGWLFPGIVKRSIRRVFLNLNAPPILVNDMLQLEWKDAGITLSRFVINSSFGLAGLMDVAAPIGLERHSSDFGQTLSLAGLGSGPYLMLPVFGPSNARDGVGDIIDTLLSPAAWFFPLGSAGQLFYGGSAGLSVREEKFEQLKALKESSVDFYASLRNAYYQHRTAEIWDRRQDRRPQASARYSTEAFARSFDLRSRLAINVSKPSRFSTEEYSERRRASSLTVPFR